MKGEKKGRTGRGAREGAEGSYRRRGRLPDTLIGLVCKTGIPTPVDVSEREALGLTIPVQARVQLAGHISGLPTAKATTAKQQGSGNRACLYSVLPPRSDWPGHRLARPPRLVGQVQAGALIMACLDFKQSAGLRKPEPVDNQSRYRLPSRTSEALSVGVVTSATN